MIKVMLIAWYIFVGVIWLSIAYTFFEDIIFPEYPDLPVRFRPGIPDNPGCADRFLRLPEYLCHLPQLIYGLLPW